MSITIKAWCVSLSSFEIFKIKLKFKFHWTIPLWILVLLGLSNIWFRVSPTNLYFEFIPKSSNIVSVKTVNVWYTQHTCKGTILLVYSHLFLPAQICTKKMTFKAVVSPRAFSRALSCLPDYRCLVLNESIKVSLVPISSSLIAPKHLFLFSAESGQLRNSSRVIVWLTRLPLGRQQTWKYIGRGGFN